MNSFQMNNENGEVSGREKCANKKWIKSKLTYSIVGICIGGFGSIQNR